MRWQRRAARGVPSCRCCVISVLNCCETGRRRRIRRSLPLRHAPAKSLKFARSTRQTQPSLTLSSGQPFCSRWRRLTDGEGERSVGAAVLASPTDRPASARHTHLHSSRSSRISHESAAVLGVFFLSVRIRCRLSPGRVAGSVRFARPAGSTRPDNPRRPPADDAADVKHIRATRVARDALRSWPARRRNRKPLDGGSFGFPARRPLSHAPTDRRARVQRNNAACVCAGVRASAFVKPVKFTSKRLLRRGRVTAGDARAPIHERTTSENAQTTESLALHMSKFADV